MDLVSGTSYWLLRNGLLASFPPLSGRRECDVAVLGAGVSGALIAWHLARAGREVVVLDRRDAGTGSSVASTGLVQYELDTPLSALGERIGPANAVRAYQACRRAVLQLERIDRRLGGAGRLRRTGSVQGASREAHVGALRAEAAARRLAGFELEWWDRRDVARESSLPFAAAIATPEAGQVDTHRLTHALLAAAARAGAHIVDRTSVVRRQALRSGVRLSTDRGFSVTARQVVIATGYEACRELPAGAARLTSTFAFVSEPCPRPPGWPGTRTVWETARPYTYASLTDDHRLLAGGADVPWHNAARRDAQTGRQARRVARRLGGWLRPAPLEIAFSWGATFAETPDGLPYIGRHPRRPHTFVALGYGGNGIPFSVVAAEIVRDLICEGASRDADLFALERARWRR